MRGDETERKPTWGRSLSGEVLQMMGKLSPPERAQKEADSSKKEADTIWPKILISRQWTDDGQTVIGPRGS
jgi:hypothetical protein